MNIKRIIHSSGLLLLFVALLSSCHGMWDEEGQDCTTHKRIRFTYDWNILFADAFSHEVKTFTLYAFDTDGNLAYQRKVNADSIIANGGYMNVDDLPSGTYTFQVWAEGEDRNANTYVFGSPQSGSTARTGLTAALSEVAGSAASASAGSSASASAVSAASGSVSNDNVVAHTPITHDLTPLYYGASGVYGTPASADFTDMPLGGNRETTINLMKDTENFRIVLADESGEAVDPSAFRFTITDDNGALRYDNSLYANTDSLVYNAWSVIAGSAGNASTQTTPGVISGMSTVVAELTTNRLVQNHQMRLHVTRTSDGKEIINLPLTDLCLLVKGQYNRAMTDQEYLDRQDTWNFVFFISKEDDKKYSWLSASIYVQQWRIVLQNVDL